MKGILASVTRALSPETKISIDTLMPILGNSRADILKTFFANKMNTRMSGDMLTCSGRGEEAEKGGQENCVCL